MTSRSLTFGQGPGADVLDVAFVGCLGLLTLGIVVLLVDAIRDRDWPLAAFCLVGAVLAGSLAVVFGRTTLPWEAH